MHVCGYKSLLFHELLSLIAWQRKPGLENPCSAWGVSGLVALIFPIFHDYFYPQRVGGVEGTKPSLSDLHGFAVLLESTFVFFKFDSVG